MLLTRRSDSRYRIDRLSQLLGSQNLHFVQFIDSLLAYDPSSRISPHEALMHPFLQPLFPFAALLSPIDPCLQDKEEEEELSNGKWDPNVKTDHESNSLDGNGIQLAFKRPRWDLGLNPYMDPLHPL
jgi:serine/threonine protein kinase